MRMALEVFGRRLDLSLGAASSPLEERVRELEKAAEPEPEYEPAPQGSTCGVLERPASWDHDTRTPLGFASTIQAMPSPYKGKN